jgi:hypothetical protein
MITRRMQRGDAVRIGEYYDLRFDHDAVFNATFTLTEVITGATLEISGVVLHGEFKVPYGYTVRLSDIRRDWIEIHIMYDNEESK